MSDSDFIESLTPNEKTLFQEQHSARIYKYTGRILDVNSIIDQARTKKSIGSCDEKAMTQQIQSARKMFKRSGKSPDVTPSTKSQP